MKPFLEHVATDLLAKYGTDLSRIAIVFPNKRAALFLNEYLARQAACTLWSPHYTTISDLFRSQSRRSVADPIKLVCDLHHCFTRCTGIDETLDHFYGWGQLLLADFDDVDKNMAPADRVFANTRDIHEYDDVSYLTAEQRDIIRRFFSNFNEEHDTELKKRFIQLWSHIGDIYHTFNERLAAQGLAYEGALYREVAEKEAYNFKHDIYIFIGFNMLQKVEQTLFRKLKQQGRARFYWDFDDNYLAKSEAGHYIAQYLGIFPNELDSHDKEVYANFALPKHITYASAPTENIQARYISTWLREQNRMSDGRKTAIVMGDEKLLQTVIHCLPDEVDKVNITTGYPLSQTSIASFITQLLNLYVYGRSKITGRINPRSLKAVRQHPYAGCLPEDFASDMPGDNASLLRWLRDLTRHIALQNSGEPTDIQAQKEGEHTPQADPLVQESLFRAYTLLNRLNDLVESGDLGVDIVTLQRLVNQVINATTIPFHGEPAEGIQVMGVLETRNLDFDHVLLLSCNEGNLPKGVSDTSFIPYSIRKAYGLTTIDHKVAIYAYYFHRLLQRATDITLVYNNSTSDGHTGEMSRFMLQMMVESRHNIEFRTLQAGQKPMLNSPQPISKTEAVVQLLRERFAKEAGGISPTAINRYMRCQLMFFYHYVCGISEPDDNEDDVIDNRIFGNIFHLSAQLVYQRLMQRSNRILATDIDQLLKTQVDIERAVDEAFKRELFQIDDPARPLPAFDGMQLINREVIIKYVRLLLEVDRRLAPFTILGLEKHVSMDYGFTTLGGTIDRLDSITAPDGSERIRVVDYKTGSRRLKALADVDAIFAPDSLKNHSDYYLQTFLYSHIVRLSSEGVPVSPALLFIQHASGEDYDPTLCLGREPVTDIATISEPFMRYLGDIISDIFNQELSFTPTDDRQRCRTCPYKGLCGI